LLPKLISIGSFYLPTYGVLVALGFLVGLTVTVRLARRSGLNGELITNLAVYCALAGLLGRLDTPARAPKPRGKAPGRRLGQCPGPRPRHPVARRRPKRAA